MEVKIKPIKVLYVFEELKEKDYFITKYGFENHHPPSIFQKINRNSYREVFTEHYFTVDSSMSKSLYKVKIDLIELSIVT
jgi:hypothetical protein